MRSLKDLSFIDIMSGPNGSISYVLIFNPYLVVRERYEASHVNENFFNSLAQRKIEIGAHDLGALPDEEVERPGQPSGGAGATPEGQPHERRKTSK